MDLVNPSTSVPAQNIRISQDEKEGQGTQTNAAKTFYLGVVYDFLGTIDGKDVPRNQFNSPIWKAAGNLCGYESVKYESKSGTVSTALYSTYPLKSAFVPATIQPGPRSVFMNLTGQLVKPPSSFKASKEFSLANPILVKDTVLEQYGTNIGAWFDEVRNMWELGMVDAKGYRSGLTLTWTVDSLSDKKGKVFIVQLARVKTDKIDTGNDFWYDGPDYPYIETNLDPKEKHVSLTHSDRPAFVIDPNEVKKPLDISYSAAFRTYLFYQDDVEGSVPVLLEYPRTWGLSFKATFTPSSGSGGRGTVKFIKTDLQPLGALVDTQLPTWKRRIVTDS
ncbi:hypothetical protein F4679DRAFT_590069 [Xylaria curta]|nr:hypothetical protein F4679DRAFT_590069 [Xylaria curta]